MPVKVAKRATIEIDVGIETKALSKKVNLEASNWTVIKPGIKIINKLTNMPKIKPNI
jgi:hypothetical protein